jgi:hypothetical protein
MNGSIERLGAMNDWNSTPAGFRENKKLMAAGCFLVGLIVLAIAIYVLATELVFINSAKPLDATIVEVRHQYVAAGRGSKLAYVPVVELPETQASLPVDSSSEENIYSVGSKVSVLCNPSRCIEDRFLKKWWGLVDLLVAFLFLVPSSLFIWRKRAGEPQLNIPRPIETR